MSKNRYFKGHESVTVCRAVLGEEKYQGRDGEVTGIFRRGTPVWSLYQVAFSSGESHWFAGWQLQLAESTKFINVREE